MTMKLELITPNSQYYREHCENGCGIQGFMVLSGSSVRAHRHGRDITVTLPVEPRVLCKQCCIIIVTDTDYQ